MSDMRFWKIAPGKKGFLWVEQRDNNCIAVGWSDIKDNLNKYKTKEAIEKKFRKVYKNSSPRQLLEFYSDVKKGDGVVASSGKWLYGVGTVTGGYKYREDLYFRHSKPVSWEYTFWEPLNVEELTLPKKLVKRLRLNRTILELTEEEWESIHKVVSRTKNPFKGLPSWEGLCRAPQTEQEVIILFSKLSQILKMKIEYVSTRFPDALVRIKKSNNWITKYVEFEINSSDFKKHEHDQNKHVKCDMIICWRDDWKRKPKNIRVVELKRELERII